MIAGVGTDIVKTARLRAAVERWGDRFLKRVFTDNEISYAYLKSNPYLSLSARFAAKEAFIKAIGKRTHVSMKDIEIVNNEEGMPSIRPLDGNFHEDMGIGSIHVSLSHEHDYSVAFVVIEKQCP